MRRFLQPFALPARTKILIAAAGTNDPDCQTHLLPE
jgi:hypothetical protein